MRPTALGSAAALLLTVLAATAADPLFEERFDDNSHGWRLDPQWELRDGKLLADGLAGEVLAVGCEGPVLDDFELRLQARAVGGGEGEGNFAYGFLYRFDTEAKNGCFLVVGPSGTYGFGTIERGAFALSARGVSPQLVDRGDEPIVLTVRGDSHELICRGAPVASWRHAEPSRGGFGLIVVDALRVAFEELRIDPLEPPAEGDGPGRVRLGPLPGGPPAAAPREPAEDRLPWYVGSGDVAVMAEWRRHYNRMAEAIGEPLLPEALDSVDIAVLGFLKYRHVSGVCPPAAELAELLVDPVMVDAGASGPGPAAAVEFWLQYARAPADPEAVGGQEDLLAGLSWYFVVRARAAAGWGDRGDYPLVLGNDLRARLAVDRQRFVGEVFDREVRSQRLTELLRARQQIRELTAKLAARAGAEP